MTETEVRDLFDAKAAGWAGKYAPGGRLAGRRARLAAAVAGRGPAVLDLGCGSGDLARHLSAAGLRVAGADISAPMLAQARQAGPGPGWVRLDPGWRVLPFRAGAFDAVVASSVLEYVADPAAVLRECARVLAPGGTLVCTVPDVRHPVRWLEWLAARLPLPPAGSRLRGYRSYLRVSRQRHGARWWAAVAAGAGLRAAPRPAAALAPLRLLCLGKPA